MMSTECEKIISGFAPAGERLSANNEPQRIGVDEKMPTSAVFGLPCYPENYLNSSSALSRRSSDADNAFKNLENLKLDRDPDFRSWIKSSPSRNRLIGEEYEKALDGVQNGREITEMALTDPSDEEICQLFETDSRNGSGRWSDTSNATLCAKTSRRTEASLKSDDGHGFYGFPSQPLHTFVSISLQKRWYHRRNRVSKLKRPFLNFYKMQVKRQKEKIKAWMSSRPNKLLN